MEDLGLTWEQIANSTAHSRADEKHSEMFPSCLAEFVPGDPEARVLQATKKSPELSSLSNAEYAKRWKRIRRSPVGLDKLEIRDDGAQYLANVQCSN